MSTDPGVLYVVATPIGNLGDISHRAVEVLSAVSLIAAEDTRHSRRLLEHFNIKTPVVSYHEHNELSVAGDFLRRLKEGQDIALISDAGTPLISDPGFPLVRLARAEQVPVVAVPGPCALVAGLSISGLATDRFFFEGFLPAKASARRKRLQELENFPHTLVFYESPHRILETVKDMLDTFGPHREGVLARELTKMYETVLAGNLAQLYERLNTSTDQRRGEFVIMISGHPEPAVEAGQRMEEHLLLQVLMQELPLKKAVELAVKLTGQKKNHLYDLAVRIKDEIK